MDSAEIRKTLLQACNKTNIIEEREKTLKECKLQFFITTGNIFHYELTRVDFENIHIVYFVMEQNIVEN